jgi:hypothetical protein
MKQKSEVSEKPFTSSLNIYAEACCRKGWGGRLMPPPSHHHPTVHPSLFVDVSFEDDVTVFYLLHDVYFMLEKKKVSLKSSKI